MWQLAPFVLPEDPAQTGRSLKEWCREDMERHWLAWQQGRPATECVASLARSRECLIRLLFERARAAHPDSPPMAVVALGGLGRRALAPFADIDVVLVSSSRRRQSVQAVADNVLYPLWDAGLDVGHAVRSPAQFAALAKTEMTIRTGALDCRPMAGDPGIFQDLSHRLKAVINSRSNKRWFLSAIQEWMEGAEASTVCRLEPNIKTGPGGLRTLHQTWWAARVAWGIPDWKALLYWGRITRHDYDALEAGHRWLQSARFALHGHCGRREDALRFHTQDSIGALLGLERPGKAPGDALLEQYYRHAKALKAAATRIQERCSQSLHAELKTLRRDPRPIPTEGFTLLNDRLRFADPTVVESSPLELLRIIRVAQRHNKRIAPKTRMEIARAVPLLFTPRVAGTSEAMQLFMAILTDPEGGPAHLEALHELGLLERLLPEFTAVTGLVQRDLYHEYTVDAHLIYCAQMTLQALSMTPGATPGDIVEAASRVQRPHVLVTAALLHDIGKGYGHGHSERGAKIARDAARRMYWKREDMVDLGFLIQEHLSMMIISQRRDLEDVDLIERFADRVETTERLDMLLVLTYADATTTGPEAFTGWKAALLRELYQRTRAALRGGAGHPGLARRAQERIDDILQRSGEDRPRMEVFTGQLTPRHLVTHRFELLRRHLQVVERAGEAGACASVSPDDQRGGWEILVACPDHAGLLADLSGVLNGRGVSVAGAYTGSTTTGTAICTFVIGAGEWPVLEQGASCADLCQALENAALQRKVDIAPIHARRRRARHYAAGVPVSATRIAYDLVATDESTVLDVFTPDRVGTLHMIAQAIFDCDVMIQQARITTEGERAVDSFYVVDRKTREPLTEARREELAEAIRTACDHALTTLDL